MQEGTLALMQLAKTLAALERLRAAGVPFLSRPVRPDDRRRLRLVRGGRRRQPRRAERPDRVRRRARLGRARSPRSCRPGSSARSSCSATASSTGSWPGRTCATSWSACCGCCRSRDCDADPGRARRARSPGFRPLSFLSTLADRVGELAGGEGSTDEEAGATATNGSGPTTPTLDAPSDGVWARVQLARNLRRPRTLEFVAAMTDDFVELHGDRLFGDDAAIVAGLARLDGRRIVVIGQQKGADTDENIRRNFGMPHPEGYRKAMRVMELAERFGLPVVTFVDVPGRPPGPRVRGARHRRGDRPLGRR